MGVSGQRDPALNRAEIGRRLLSDRARCEQMGRAARARAEACFGWERVARDFEQMLDEVTEARRERSLCAA